MNSISACIDSLIAIDDQVFLAECDVMLANDIWMNKMSDMIKYSGNSDSMISYIQEADYGRRYTGGNQWLSKLRIFILKCIDKIVDAVTNFLLKIKTRKAEYIRIPYKYEDLMEDINLVKSIDKEIYQIFDNVENFASADNVKKLADIKEKLRNTHFAKNQRFIISNKDPEAHNKLNKYGVKPDQYMKLAKELRELNRAFKDTKTRASKMVQKEWLKDPNSIDKPSVVIQELLFNIYTEMSKMMVKLMQSFTVSGVEKMNQEVIEKKIVSIKTGIINLQKIIDESVEYDIDDDELEFFDETEKPFDDYLKKHNYDPKTNTVEIDGVRHNAGKIPSKKERNRINRFLRENNYDPKTETIETDITDKDGKYKRMKFSMDNAVSSAYRPAYQNNDEVINIDTKHMTAKPAKSNQVFKHEEGHAAQMGQPGTYHQYSKTEHKSSNTPVATSKEDLHKFIDDNPVDGRAHYQDFELDADLYGYQHSRYASKDKKRNKAELINDENDNKAIRRINKQAKSKRSELVTNAKQRVASNVEFKLNTAQSALKGIIKDLNDIEEMLKRSKQNGNVSKDDSFTFQLFHQFNIFADTDELDKATTIDDLEKFIESNKRKLEMCKRDVEKAQKDIDNISHDKYDDVDEYNRRIKNIDQMLSDSIKQSLDALPIARAERNNRNKFLDQHADEAGSKARKLEGRQGKHKGKK